MLILAFAVALHGHVKRKCHRHGQSGDFRLLQLHLRGSGQESRHLFRHSLGLLRSTQGGVCRTRPNRQTPPQRRSRGPGRPAQPRAAHLFLPRALEHSGKPANVSRGREIQRSTSCNPRILQGRGMFDGNFLVFNHFQTLVQKDPPNGETEARTPSPTPPNLPGLCIELGICELCVE